MNELIDFKKILDRAVELWREHFLSIIFCGISFALGGAYANKMIVDDCKFAKSFRDGATVYDCQVRLR